MIPSHSPILIFSFKILAVFIRVELVRVIKILENAIVVSLAHVTVFRVLLESWSLLILPGLVSIVIIVDLLKESGHATTLSFLLTALVLFFLFLHAFVLILQLLDLVFAQRSTQLGEVFDHSWPLDCLHLHVLLHSIKDLLESFRWQAGVSLRVTSDCTENLANILVLAERHEEGDCVHGVGAKLLLRVIDASDQADLLL